MTLFLTHLVMLFITHFEKLFVTHFVTLFVTHFLTLLYRILYNAFCSAFFNALCNAYFLHRITVDNKGFSGIQKSKILQQNRNFKFLLLKYILKWKDCQVDPIGLAPLYSSGDKHFSKQIKGNP